MTQRLLTHLRHVDLAVPDYEAQLDFYRGLWGLVPVAQDPGISFLAAHARGHGHPLSEADERPVSCPRP
ncbi:VOC family protein [Streptomyces samsunensis]|uniref:VOC family protein n=1 Tax=Streptomyces malaysiensis subsp. samsunensis TaxID=459658 RepID=A0A9X2RVS0_STRMQ|nr:VOC family protein [Streptomyces samsunensis]MCQ8830069.1 VOC family protein [Streptomyces samsunensis]